MVERVLITSALIYANGSAHFGHIAGAFLSADVFARFCRLQGRDTLYVSGSDEYGVPITLTAEREGVTPLEHAERYHRINQELFRRMNFSFDHFSRTSQIKHCVPVYEFFQELMANGYIEARQTSELYSEYEGRFLADRYVVGTCPSCGYEDARGDECPRCAASYEATDLKAPRSKLTRAPLTLRPTTHWYLRLDLLRAKLESWLHTRHWKPTVIHFLEGYLKDTRPRAITRDGEWGVPVPLSEAKGKVFYVWFEALIGYISISIEWAELSGDPDAWRSFWQDPATRLVHFIGKDNTFFHGLFFPAMIMGQNQPYKLVDDLPANEFLMLEGRQFSKSEGWYIDLADFLDRYSVDQLRYTLAVNAPETGDSEFTWHDFQMRCNAELVGKYGNLANRTLVFAQRQCEGKIPSLKEPGELERALLADIERLCGEIAESYDGYKLRHACHLLMELAKMGNVYFDAKQPWVAARDESRHSEMQTTIRLCLECLRAMAVASFPIIPETANRLWRMVGFEGSINDHLWNEALTLPLRAGAALPKPDILFRKIEDLEITEELARLGRN